MASKKGSISTWDWTKIEALVLSGHSAKMIKELPEFREINVRYLANQITLRGFVKKREELKQAALATVDKTIVDRRSVDVEKHHTFAFDVLESMRSAIKEHRIRGSVRELREMMTLFQQYIDAAESSYGLKGEQVKSSEAVSLNAMVALHIMPPSKAEVVDFQSQVISASVEGDSHQAEHVSEGVKGDENHEK